MKLLLTSGGITNTRIADALLELIGKRFEETKLAFVPTAANVEVGDKSWLIEDFNKCKELGFLKIDIVDIAAIERHLWLPRLEYADVILVGGGNTFYLLNQIKKSGLEKELPKLLESKVYVGISAGSMVLGKAISLSDSKRLYDEDIDGFGDDEALGYLDFEIRPHLNSPFFKNVREEILQETTKNAKSDVYVLDDQSAIKVDGDKRDFVGGGKHIVYKKNG